MDQSRDRWDRWLENPSHKEVMIEIADYVEDKYSNSKLDYFAPHDKSHCLAVEKLIKALINNIKCKLAPPLNELEKFILFISAWSHDIGMLEVIATDYKKANKISKLDIAKRREIHDDISAWALLSKDNFFKIFENHGITRPDFEKIIYIVNYISKFHRKACHIKECLPTRSINQYQIRTDLLACLLRLGDTLHKDNTRFDQKLFDILQIGHFDRSAQLHWLKSFVVSSISLNIDKQTIFIDVSLPEFDEDEKKDLEHSIESLQFIIKEDILEDILSVQDIFKKYNLPFYNNVEVSICFIPGIKGELKNELQEILYDLDILLSPNTSAVISKALDSIISLSKKEFNDDDYDDFLGLVEQLNKNLKGVHGQRSCHVGLWKIIELVEEKYEKFKKLKREYRHIDDSKAELDEIIKIKTDRITAQKVINEKGQVILQYVDNIILFGYSGMVLSLLNSLNNRDINLYILSCYGKNRYSANDRLEYNDGMHYAFTLNKMGFNRLNVLPETSLIALIVDKVRESKSKKAGPISVRIKPENTVVLFGANGICELNKYVGHSAGHKMVAMVARNFNIPVIVIADSFKFGEIQWRPGVKRDGNNWFTGNQNYIRELKNKNINLINYREDKMESELIFKIITELKELDYTHWQFFSNKEVQREWKKRLRD